MRKSLSLLAAISRSQPSKLKRPAISLDHFIQRQRVIALWREIVRALNSTLASLEIPPSSTRDELHSYARQEFERHREVTELVCHPFRALTTCRHVLITDLFPWQSHIRYLISTGKAEFETMKRYIDEQVAG
ncbi:hypothetical protein N7462_008486 [Penicillium macrosclerotiorum]|uniref:uncharacterized protein n=1 Tax=Penicillium macrosclerotiorum TaxID=303699 RepID=UPI002546E218|nr:uncharacterized protein N7462_008486 [Penicillium macrosclerotiorum]KAJ5675589.1 hypothetical protein N7462_008486 [Penicillium macrosclerotiorum]